MIEALVVHGHDADLYRTEHAVEIDAEGDALNLRGLGEQSLDVSAEVLKTAAVVDLRHIFLEAEHTLRFYGGIGEHLVDIGNAADVNLELAQAVDQLPERSDCLVHKG